MQTARPGKFLKIHTHTPAKNAALRTKRIEVHDKTIEIHEKLWGGRDPKEGKNITGVLDQRNRLAARDNVGLFSAGVPIKSMAYAPFPLSPKGWKEFSLFGHSFSKVWFPARAFLFTVALPFKLVAWPLSTGSRFLARVIYRKQMSTRIGLNKQAFRDLRHKLESSGFKNSVTKAEYDKAWYAYNQAIEGKRIEEEATAEAIVAEGERRVTEEERRTVNK